MKNQFRFAYLDCQYTLKPRQLDIMSNDNIEEMFRLMMYCHNVVTLPFIDVHKCTTYYTNIVSREKFMDKFHELTDGIFVDFSWDSICIFGKFVSDILRQNICQPDINIVIEADTAQKLVHIIYRIKNHLIKYDPVYKTKYNVIIINIAQLNITLNIHMSHYLSFNLNHKLGLIFNGNYVLSSSNFDGDEYGIIPNKCDIGETNGIVIKFNDICVANYDRPCTFNIADNKNEDVIFSYEELCETGFNNVCICNHHKNSIEFDKKDPTYIKSFQKIRDAFNKITFKFNDCVMPTYCDELAKFMDGFDLTTLKIKLIIAPYISFDSYDNDFGVDFLDIVNVHIQI